MAEEEKEVQLRYVNHGERKRRILIIEDNALNREILTLLLEDQYEIQAAICGAVCRACRL